jgi:proteasome lid subunit RPN8/RPN11
VIGRSETASKGSEMVPVQITRATYAAITDHAIETFPSECCGFIVERQGREKVVRVTNIQDELHARDPKTHPRTSAIAYSMGNEVVDVLRDQDSGEIVIRSVYHSHPQHDAYFSEEDLRNATPFGDPTFPDAAQIVISVYDRSCRDAKAFRWDAAMKQYVEAPLEITQGRA